MLASCRTGYTRVIVEKPFGKDSESFRQLSADLYQHLTEDQMYRIDHYLGKELIENLTVRLSLTDSLTTPSPRLPLLQCIIPIQASLTNNYHLACVRLCHAVTAGHIPLLQVKAVYLRVSSHLSLNLHPTFHCPEAQTCFPTSRVQGCMLKREAELAELAWCPSYRF